MYVYIKCYFLCKMYYCQFARFMLELKMNNGIEFEIIICEKLDRLRMTEEKIFWVNFS